MLSRQLIYFLFLSLIIDVFSALTNESSVTGYSNIDPYMNIITSVGVDELSLDISEKHYANAQKLFSESGSSELYIKLGSYPLCILSNDIDKGIFLKISSPDSPDYTKIVNGNKQLSMYNKSTGDKIALILVITPAGWTKNPQSFGYSFSSSSASKGIPFVVGAAQNNGSDALLQLVTAVDTALPRRQKLKNLALDTFGIINHYGLNPVLKSTDVLLDTKNNGSEKIMRGCVGDKEPSDGESFVDLSIVFDVYINSQDLSRSSAGKYHLQFATNWADSNDIS